MDRLIAHSAFFRLKVRHDAALSRTLLIAGCAGAIGVAAWAGDPSGYLLADPALARLLRGMALIKAFIVGASMGLSLWRFGFPSSAGVVTTYVVGCSIMAGSTMLIWQLTAIPLAAILFHAAAIGMLVIGWHSYRKQRYDER